MHESWIAIAHGKILAGIKCSAPNDPKVLFSSVSRDKTIILEQRQLN